ncbi:MAG: hypothetical protein HC822_28090 [Oscillochloris sp.]|nr:hypothetical protein [Oscillochloris sp.]
MAEATLSGRAAGVPRARSAALVRWRAYLLAEVNGASLALFRVLFGLVMAWEVVRYVQHGWIARYYIAPKPGFVTPGETFRDVFHDFHVPYAAAICSMGMRVSMFNWLTP